MSHPKLWCTMNRSKYCELVFCASWHPQLPTAYLAQRILDICQEAIHCRWVSEQLNSIREVHFNFQVFPHHGRLTHLMMITQYWSCYCYTLQRPVFFSLLQIESKVPKADLSDFSSFILLVNVKNGSDIQCGGDKFPLLLFIRWRQLKKKSLTVWNSYGISTNLWLYLNVSHI